LKNYDRILLIILLSSCKPMAQQMVHEKTLEAIVMERLGTQATIEKNKNQTFALAYQANHSTQAVAYLVIRLSDLKIVEEATRARIILSWMDTYKIKISITPGILRKDEPINEPEIIDVTKYIVKL